MLVIKEEIYPHYISNFTPVALYKFYPEAKSL